MTAADAWDERPGPDGPDFEPVVPLVQPKRRSGLRYALVAIVVLVGAGAGAWYQWGDSLFIDPNAEIPLVRAEGGPIKVRPESPGGMDVPDRDKLVYDRIDGNGERPSVERLLPPPEMPQPLPTQPAEPPANGAGTIAPAGEVAPKPQTAEVPENAPGTSAPPPVPPASEPAPSVAEVLSTMRPPPPPEDADEVAPTMQPKSAAPTPKPAPAEAKPEAKPTETASLPDSTPAPAVQPAGGAYRIQLAAVRERGAVDAEWKRLQKKYNDLLGKLELSVQRADLGPGKGVYYRLRAGPLSDEATARELCDKLKARKVGCLIVRPKS